MPRFPHRQAPMMRGGMAPEFYARGPPSMGPMQGSNFAPGPPPCLQTGPPAPMPPMHCPPPAWGPSVAPMYSPHWGQPLPPQLPTMPMTNPGFNVQGSNMQYHFPPPVPPRPPPPNLYPIQGPPPVPYIPPQNPPQAQNQSPRFYPPIPFPPPVNLPPPLLPATNSEAAPAALTSPPARPQERRASPGGERGRGSYRPRYRSRSGSRGRDYGKRRSQTPIRSRDGSRERRFSRGRERDYGRRRLESRNWERGGREKKPRERRSPRPRREPSGSRSCKSYHQRSPKPSSPVQQVSPSAPAPDTADSSKSDSSKQAQALPKMTPEEMIEQEKKLWLRSAPADLHYIRDEEYDSLYNSNQ